MARTTSRSSVKSAPQSADLVAQVTAAVLAALQGEQTKPAPKGRTKPTQAAPAAPRRVKPENVDRAASMRAVCGAFFQAFQVIYGEKLEGWPTLGDLEAIRDDLAQRIG